MSQHDMNQQVQDNMRVQYKNNQPMNDNKSEQHANNQPVLDKYFLVDTTGQQPTPTIQQEDTTC
jgi:hypothetical protein